MTDGGGSASVASEGGSTASGGESAAHGDGAGAGEGAGAGGWRARLRRHRLLASGAAVVVLAAAVVVPVTVGAAADAGCWKVPASARALARDPAAATKALDPGDGLERLGTVRRLLVHERVCGDGADVLGRVVAAGTGVSSPTAPHTVAQARGAYAVASLFAYADPPAGLEPALARTLAAYLPDVVRDYHHISLDEETSPAMTPEEAARDDTGQVHAGRFAAPGEAHAAFRYGGGAGTNMESMVSGLVTEPRAFAVLYDAERAYLAFYLERLTDEGGDPDARPVGGDGASEDMPAGDLRHIAECVGQLMGYRTRYAQDGDIPDLEAFDSAVRAHTAGAYRPASHRLDTRPAMGTIAVRHPAGALHGDPTDGRHQMLGALDAWGERRHVPAKRLDQLRHLIDVGYVRGLWYASTRP